MKKNRKTESGLRRWLRYLVQRRFAKWPRRRARYPVRIILSEDQRDHPRCLNDIVRQAGYTNGDRMVVMLESDFQRVAALAHKKIESPLMAMVWHQIEHSHLDRISTLNDQGVAPTESGQPDSQKGS